MTPRQLSLLRLGGSRAGGLVAVGLLALGSTLLAQPPQPGTPQPGTPQPGTQQTGTETEPAFSVLASYTFDDGRTATGPDTFRVFERARGRVTRTPHFRLSGEHSLELRDVARNGDFPELQGYFDRRTEGQLYAHFAFLVIDPAEELNVVLAGPRGFRLEKDGFAFWLRSRDGVLRHVSDSIPKKLFLLQPYTWYLVDVLYDIARGRYQLWIEEEGAVEPRVELTDQPNAANQPGPAVDKFSFVSDPFEDRSEVVYYVDDVVLGVDEVIPPRRFVAPGRRKLFVEMEIEAEKERLAAVAATASAGQEMLDSGRDERAAGPDRWWLAMADGRFGLAYREARGRLTELRGESEAGNGARALWLERAADAALLDGDPALALQLYDEAATAAGGRPSPGRLLKRADAYHLLGDAAAEKRLREAIYGTLDSPTLDPPRPSASSASATSSGSQ